MTYSYTQISQYLSCPRRYQSLRQQVLERDGWRCQSCGLLSNLQVHHLQSRSHQGDDSGQNLLTLCVQCHRNVHIPGRNPKLICRRGSS